MFKHFSTVESYMQHLCSITAHSSILFKATTDSGCWRFSSINNEAIFYDAILANLVSPQCSGIVGWVTGRASDWVYVGDDLTEALHIL